MKSNDRKPSTSAAAATPTATATATAAIAAATQATPSTAATSNYDNVLSSLSFHVRWCHRRNSIIANCEKLLTNSSNNEQPATPTATSNISFEGGGTLRAFGQQETRLTQCNRSELHRFEFEFESNAIATLASRFPFRVAHFTCFFSSRVHSAKLIKINVSITYPEKSSLHKWTLNDTIDISEETLNELSMNKGPGLII